jgi:DNA polymerase I-like protein with 3'-5' exonuclease and polymerase domains
MARKISISFKETTKDIELYNYIMSLEDKSSEVKLLLRKAIKDEKIIKSEIVEKVEENIDILDF